MGNPRYCDQAALGLPASPLTLLLSRRVTAPVDPAHVLGALLVAGLLLPTFVTDDALIVATSGWLGVGRFALRPLAFLHHLVARLLSDVLLGLRFAILLKLGHDGLLP
jgi:hypothetical protein